MGWGDEYGGWPEYVPVAKKIARAKKAAEKLRKKGTDVQPVELSGRKIASSFWGKGWCDHMESYRDFENRLPRGRSYVRNGSVVHLDVAKGQIKALVAGTKTYSVEIKVELLSPMRWQWVKERCAGQIASLLDLLKGKLSDGVMRIVTDRDNGLFPGPDEFKMKCSCPDYAGMCKHIAAVFYGVGARLDQRPELLFLLRGVDHAELAVDGGVEAVIDQAADTGDQLAGGDLSALFGIEMVRPEDGAPPNAKPKKSAAGRQEKGVAAGKAKSKSTTNPKKESNSKRTPAKTAKGGKLSKQPAAADDQKPRESKAAEKLRTKSVRKSAASKTAEPATAGALSPQVAIKKETRSKRLRNVPETAEKNADGQ